MRNYVIAIDGPAASGKSTTAKRLSTLLNYTYIDTGAMYRAVALAAKNEKIDTGDKQALEELLEKLEIDFHRIASDQKIFLNGVDVSLDIRNAEITKLSSIIATIPLVREKLVEMQRELGRSGKVIMDGRDIGTVVFPDADFKFYLIASVKTRALRRWKELPDTTNISVEEIEQELIWRDRNDSSRAVSPLRKADDAIEIDTTDLTIDEQVNTILKFVTPLL